MLELCAYSSPIFMTGLAAGIAGLILVRAAKKSGDVGKTSAAAKVLSIISIVTVSGNILYFVVMALLVLIAVPNGASV